MESRKGHTAKTQRLAKSALLPSDYLALVTEVVTASFGDSLKALEKLRPKPAFRIHGAVFTDEIVMAISLVHEGVLPATTVYASTDFDPKASSPTAQDLLAACVDAIGAFYEQLLDVTKPEHLERVSNSSLAAMDDIPFEWTKVMMERTKIFIKVDKSNPDLDNLADQWLSKNDPDHSKLEEENEKAAKELFMTGPGTGPGTKKDDSGLH